MGTLMKFLSLISCEMMLSDNHERKSVRLTYKSTEAEGNLEEWEWQNEKQDF